MSQPKRHHIVPAFYLRRFAVNDQVTAVDRSDFTRSFTTSVDNVPVESQFYSIASDDGWDPAVEAFLANDIEGPAKRAIERLVEGRVALTLPGIRRRLSVFLAVQYVRGRASRKANIDFFLALTQKIARTMTAPMVQKYFNEQGEVCSLDEAQGIVEFARNTANYSVGLQPVGDRALPPDSLLHLQNALPNADRLVPYFEQRSWRILEFDEPCLVTGDEPVTPIGSFSGPGEPTGLAVAEDVIFPLDPRHLLVMVRPDKRTAQRWRKCGVDQARDINQHIAFRAERHIIYQPGTDPLNGMVLPEKAPMVRTVGDQVFMQLAVSKDAAAKFDERFQKRPQSRGR